MANIKSSLNELVSKKEFHIEWFDRRSTTDRLNNAPHFYYVALSERHESDSDIGYFLNKDKAEEYARKLYEEYKDYIVGEKHFFDLTTHIVPFND